MAAPEERAEEIVIAGEIPQSFDARANWPECKSIGMIRDQSACGSCWAVSAASAMSDRLCVQSKGGIKAILSAADILSCCAECGYGCQGGWPIEAWRYLVREGVCTGGAYGQENVCKPYPFYPCGHHEGQKYHGPCPRELFKTPECSKQCNGPYNKTYEEDKFFGKSAYYLPNSMAAIQKEIMTNGPVQAVMKTYQDFSFYKGGIYMHAAGALTGAKSVKLIGWGSENGVPYWLVANTWNSDWGENGYFRILRGTDECGIESQVVAGMMRV
ncbi:papain family cysteine protease [Ancylostoma duodenale]|uniref:Papain family cysteine protease n=1 Tax=Ancylostoma duodenale TaxID=51022 RepID=A0A0C2CVD8_9BILA|nr:papain family cysteine protease [Ancylostoma duodenale]